MKPREYQQKAHDRAIAFVARLLDPCLIEAATGAGKSIIIAMLGLTLFNLSNGKKVICLAPSAKLVKQNREKFLATGHPASIFSASAGVKCMRHPVVFATPVTVLNSIDKICHNVCAIIVDEAHKMPPTMIEIIDKFRAKNPLIRVIGLTATPYVRGKGYIYAMGIDDEPVPEDQCQNPYFKKLVFRITKEELEAQGFLTPARIMPTHAESYDLSKLPRKAVISEAELDEVYLGQGRQTAQIVAEIVDKTRNRFSVMIFAATVRHALEIAASLPENEVRVIGGEINMERRAREKLERDFEEGKFKYLVSVGTMTTGVDFPDVDVIAILRYSDSLSLLEQIIGRGSRLPVRGNKKDFLLFDYADNLERHYGEEVDMYNPKVVTSFSDTEKIYINALCSACGNTNSFSARLNPGRLEYDDEGYFLDLAGQRIQTEHGPVPGHFGRRCTHFLKIGANLERCTHRWTEKVCRECEFGNDIAAKYCANCKAELVNPNDKLVTAFKKYKKNPRNIQCDRIVRISHIKTLSKMGGDECLRVSVETEYRKFDYWLHPKSQKKWLVGMYDQYMKALDVGITTITYKKNEKGFFDIHDYNKPADEAPTA